MGIRAQFSGVFAAACALALICASVSVPAQDTASNTDSSKSTAPATEVQAGAKTEDSKKKTGAGPEASQTHTGKTASARHTTHSSSATNSKSSAATGHSSKSKQAATSRRGGRKRTARGQQKIDARRAQEIQAALIREHYLTGEADGNWNAACEEAMRRYQADHGWQSKTVPDARALISLGLGPNHDHLLNPESAMTTEPAAPHAATLAPTSQSPAAAAATPTTPGKTTQTQPASDPPPVSTPAHDPSGPQ